MTKLYQPFGIKECLLNKFVCENSLREESDEPMKELNQYIRPWKYLEVEES